MSDAVKPNFYAPIETVEDKILQNSGATDVDRWLSSLNRNRGWRVLRQFIEDLSSDLDRANRMAITSGASLEEIGRNAVVSAMAKDVIQKILNKVDDATDAVEQINEQ